MAQVVECLAGKHKALSSNTRNPKQNTDYEQPIEKTHNMRSGRLLNTE
jgi:hypothetical protein